MIQKLKKIGLVFDQKCAVDIIQLACARESFYDYSIHKVKNYF